MEVDDLKGRIAEALVESIFRRASYRVARVGRESSVQGLVKVGASEFSADFLVWKQVSDDSPDRHLHRLLTIEVKYRSNLPEFIKRNLEPLVEKVRPQWPELYCVFVTDNPEDARSCFQVFDVKNHMPGTAPILLDLHQLPGLDIFRTTVEEYEGLVRQIFPLLGSYGRDS